MGPEGVNPDARIRASRRVGRTPKMLQPVRRNAEPWAASRARATPSSQPDDFTGTRAGRHARIPPTRAFPSRGMDEGSWYSGPMARARVKIWFPLLLVPAILAVGGASYLIWRQRVPPVRATLSPAPKFIGVRTALALDLHAAR